MENIQAAPQQFPEHIYEQAANLLVSQKQRPEEAIESLKLSGLAAEDARTVVETLHGQITKIKKAQANKDILYGALWCGGGTIATLANIGFIFWGAIIFGGIQLVKGIVNYSSIK